MNETTVSPEDINVKIYTDEHFILADELADIVWTADLGLHITYLNKAVTPLLGYIVPELLFKKITDICEPESASILSEKIREEINKETSSKADKSRIFTVELKHICRDGGLLWSETKVGILRNRLGGAVGFIGISRDITERRRQQNVLQQGRLLTIIGQMTSAIASEINNPVGGILLSSEQLMMAELSGQARKDLAMIHEEARRVAKMMTNLLNSCNLAPQKMERYKLNRLINKVIEIRKYAHEKNNIIVTTNLQNQTLYVMCDSHQLQQVFTRLMQDSESALQKQNGGNIVITSRLFGDWARVSMSDDRHHENFSNLVLNPPLITAKPAADITRLDMILCHAIITAHGGQLYSEYNRMGGNTFVVELPVYKTLKQ